MAAATINRAGNDEREVRRQGSAAFWHQLVMLPATPLH